MKKSTAKGIGRLWLAGTVICSVGAGMYSKHKNPFNTDEGFNAFMIILITGLVSYVLVRWALRAFTQQ